MKIIFLGFTERAALVRDSETPLLKWNILGLKQSVLAFFLPINLSHFKFAFACNGFSVGKTLFIKISDEMNHDIGSLNIATHAATESDLTRTPNSILMCVPPTGWTISVFELPKTDITIQKPGRYFLSLCTEQGEELIGEFDIILADAVPPTPEKVAAIKMDPHAAKSAMASIACRICSSKILIYTALERNPVRENEGYLWYQDIPDQFTCRCGATKLDLGSMKRNFFTALGHPVPLGRKDDSDVSYVPLYEQSLLRNVQHEFIRLLDRDPPEEILQTFIEQNPILLHQFPAEKLFFKPMILTFFKADFAILTSRKELILIEIEKAKTPLMKKDGGQAAPLTHAFDQVQSWLHVVDEHRLAVLDSLKINREQVGQVRGVIIAGREAGYDAEHLRRLRGIDHGRVSFLTFDDLAFSLGALIRPMSQT